MLLTIDIGNTNITLGLYDGKELGPRWRLATAFDHMPDEYGLQLLGLIEHAGHTAASVDGICLASVVPPITSKIIEACRRYLNREPLVVDAGVKTGVRVRYEDPRAVGADRIVDAVAVFHLYGVPACVVDFGTATTFDAISKNGDYLGGAIAPGIGIAADALLSAHCQAAAGRSTKTALGDWSQHRPFDAIGVALRLCRAGGGHGGTFSPGIGSEYEGDRYGRSGRYRRP